MPKRQWRIVDRAEKKVKEEFFKSLTVQKSIGLFSEAYDLICGISGRNNLKKPNTNKIELLSRTHSFFNNVKP